MSSDEPPKKRRRTTASPAASAAPQSAPTPSQTKYRVKERTLVFSTRGIGHRERFLMQDLRDLLPHSKRDSKLDSKKRLHEAVNEVCEMKNCSSCLFFEARKRQDTYLWAGCVPLGPTAKFLVQNVHTMAELKLTGNCLKGARPVLSFDRTFEATPELRLLRQLLTRVFNSPRGHPKTKPFVDHVFHFSWLDNRIWFRNYQVNFDAVSNLKRSKQSDPVLVEIGPRFVLLPIKIFEGSFQGTVLYTNPDFVSPNRLRALQRKEKRPAGRKKVKKIHTEENEFQDVFAVGTMEENDSGDSDAQMESSDDE